MLLLSLDAYKLRVQGFECTISPQLLEQLYRRTTSFSGGQGYKVDLLTYSKGEFFMDLLFLFMDKVPH